MTKNTKDGNSSDQDKKSGENAGVLFPITTTSLLPLEEENKGHTKLCPWIPGAPNQSRDEIVVHLKS